MKKDGKTIKRVLSLIMAFAMLLTLMPTVVFADTGTTVYLVPNANWKDANARFAVYYFDDNAGTNGWVSMTDADGDGYYEGTVPAGYSKIIFCRMNPSTTDNNWDNRWNQTADLTLDDTNNCYTVAEGTWDQGGGTWAVYTPATPDPSEESSEPAATDYTVTFNSNGGSEVATQTVKSGEKATKPTDDPTKDGYTFDGWYSDEALTKAYDFDTAVTADLNLYAKWTENTAVTCTVTFVSNDGSEVAAQTVTSGDKATKPTDPTKDGCSFDGWYSDEDLSTAYNFDSAVTADLTLYAKWAEIAPASTTLYLVPGSEWSQASAWFAAYYWSNADDSGWVKLTDDNADGYYECTIPSGYSNIIFTRNDPSKPDLNWNSNWNQTADQQINGNCFTITGPWEGDGQGATGTWSNYTPSTTPAEPVTWATIHYRNTGLWKSVYGYAWTEGATDAEDAPIFAWPGTELTEETDHKNWYTLTLTELDAANGIGVIFNNHGGSQTDNISITASGEYWYDNGLLTDEPETWADGTVKTIECTFTFHFANAKSWSNVYLYAWSAIGEAVGSWPGSKAGIDSDGFYTYSFTAEVPEGLDLNFIFNNGNNGSQTVDLAIAAAEIKDGSVEKWIAPTTENTDDGDDSTAKYYCDIQNVAAAVAISPKVDGTSVTFQYKNATAGTVKVFGTMGMAEGTTDWVGYDMTKNDYGVWSVTLTDLEPGTHRYKFVVDDNWILDPINSWTYVESNNTTNSAFLILDPNAEDSNEITIRFHYSREDYTGWNLSVWTLSGVSQQCNFKEENGEMIATVTVDGRATQYVSFIPRRSTEENLWAEQDFGERRVDVSDVLSGTIDVYLTAGQYNFMRVLNTDVVQENKINSVELDYDTGKIIVTTSKLVSAEDPKDVFSIVNTNDDQIAIDSVSASGSTYTLTLNETLDLVNLYKYKIKFSEQKNHANYEYDIGINTVYASEKFGSEFTYDGDDLGATWTASSTTFRLWAPTAEAVKINLYTSGTAGTADLIKQVEMTPSDNGTWVATVEGDLNKTYYTYSVTRDGETVEAVDPYARTTGVNGKRGMVIDLDSTDPTGWTSDKDPNPLASYTDAIIYELHVRDFSIGDSSGVTDEWQGKFLGLTQSGTTSTDNTTVTGLDYLKSLGITHLHLLPVYDYGSVDETTCSTFNWGYDPVNYNVPEGSYSTDPTNGEVRVEEFKQMVSTLHDNGISVIMDVVYNHVYDAGAFCMNQIVPGYFSRQNSDGSYSNGSGCGNDTASEREMVRKYIVDSVNYWADEYHVDGFRFDLVGLLDATTINQIVDTVHENHPGALFYGEGWTLGTAVEPGNTMATQANSNATPEFAYFSDTMRNLLGGTNGSSLGFVSGLTGQEEAVANNFMASPWWTSNPTQIIQYASCHDNYTLIDKLVLSTGKSGIDADIIKMNNLAAAIYLTSQGIPFIHAGEEFLREKLEEGGGRCENSYNASDAVNHIEWSKLEDATYAKNSDYYKGLIAFRKAHPALRLATNALVEANVTYDWITNEVVRFTINGANITGEPADKIVVIFNANNSAKNVILPGGTWNICINGEKAGTESLDTATGSVSVGGISAMVLTQTEEVFVDNANSLILDGMVHVKQYLTFQNIGDMTKEQILANSSVEITPENGEPYTASLEYSGVKDGVEEYYVKTNGIPAKELGDTIHFRFSINVNGKTRYYEKDYSPLEYAYDRFKNSNSAELKSLLVAMLNYGAEAQEYFGYKTDELVNANLKDYVNEEYLKEEYLEIDWKDTYLTALVEPSDEMIGEFATKGDITDNGKSLLLEGAFTIKYYMGIGEDASAFEGATEKTMYFWTAEDYQKLLKDSTPLTKENASYSVDAGELTYGGSAYGYEFAVKSNQFYSDTLGDTLYSVFCITDANGDEHCSGVEVFSPEAYASIKINDGTNAPIDELMKWMVVYGERAKAYFESLQSNT